MIITYFHVILFLFTDESFPSIAIAAIATVLSLILLLIGIITIVCAAVIMNKNKDRGIIMFCFQI